MDIKYSYEFPDDIYKKFEERFTNYNEIVMHEVFQTRPYCALVGDVADVGDVDDVFI